MKLAHFNWVELVLDSDLPSNAKYIALYLATFMNGKNHVAWPSLSRISHETGLSRPTAVKWIEFLESGNWLVKTKRLTTTSGGEQYGNEYGMNIPQKLCEISQKGSKADLPPTQKGSKAVLQRGLNGLPKVVKQFNPNNNKNNKGSNNKGKARPKDAAEVAAYAESIGYPLDGQRFIDHYEANGWMRGKTKIKDWKACVRTWKANDNKSQQPQQQSTIRDL